MDHCKDFRKAIDKTEDDGVWEPFHWAQPGVAMDRRELFRVRLDPVRCVSNFVDKFETQPLTLVFVPVSCEGQVAFRSQREERDSIQPGRPNSSKTSLAVWLENRPATGKHKSRRLAPAKRRLFSCFSSTFRDFPPSRRARAQAPGRPDSEPILAPHSEKFSALSQVMGFPPQVIRRPSRSGFFFTTCSRMVALTDAQT